VCNICVHCDFTRKKFFGHQKCRVVIGWVGAGFAAWTKVRSGDNDPVTKICGSVPRVKIVKKIQRAPGFYFGFTKVSAITNYQL
jgi:hypothetical protein